jgi:Calcineurin-like phosphoesterase
MSKRVRDAAPGRRLLGKPIDAGSRTRPRRRATVLCLALLFIAVRASLAKDAASTWTGVRKVVVVGDLHGDYENFEKIIRGTGLVDHALHWTAGDTHFVQTGDIMDRGPDPKKILDVLMSLEAEAEAAGGKVHVLLGNHEELNIGGVIFRYPDYLTVDQFTSFLPERYQRRQERELEKSLNIARARGDRTPPETLAEEFWNALKNDPVAQREYLINFNNKYGKWLLRRKIIIKINETVFVHGGISEAFSLWGLEKINDLYRKELSDIQKALVYGEPTYPAKIELAYRGDGPLWYRDLATVPEPDMREELDRILANLGARHLVIAHTPRTAVTIAEMKRFDGKVWIVDTGISKSYNNNLSALLIIDGEFSVWGGDHEEKDNTGLAASFSAVSRREERLGAGAR